MIHIIGPLALVVIWGMVYAIRCAYLHAKNTQDTKDYEREQIMLATNRRNRRRAYAKKVI